MKPSKLLYFMILLLILSLALQPVNTTYLAKAATSTSLEASENAVVTLHSKNKRPSVYADSAIFHQPNGKFYLRAAKKLGFKPEQYKDGLLTPNVGNTYSGAVPLALSNVLDKAEPGDKIFIVSYGSGAGSDGFTLTVNDRIEEVKNLAPTTEEILSKKIYVDYAVYAKFKGKLRMA